MLERNAMYSYLGILIDGLYFKQDTTILLGGYLCGHNILIFRIMVNFGIIMMYIHKQLFRNRDR